MSQPQQSYPDPGVPRAARIAFFHHTLPLAAYGMVAEALTLPRDETTAVVGLAALLARRHRSTPPGEYSAVFDPCDGTRPIIITGDDPRVTTARTILRSIAPHRDYDAAELTTVRDTLLFHDQHPTPRHSA